MNILITANTDWFLHNFRLALIKVLVARGDRVSIACPDGDYRRPLEAFGVRWYPVTVDRSGTNPLRDLASVRQHRAVLDAVRPDLVHSFTLKSVIATGLAARATRFAGLAMVNNYDGLGYVFSSGALKARLARPLVRMVLRRLNRRERTAAVVLNTADRATFAAESIAPPVRTEVIPGAGVDLARFTVQSARIERFTLLYASRLLYAKGVAVAVEAVSLLISQGRDVILRIAGAADPGNPDSVRGDELAAWSRLAYVELLGHRADIDQLIAASSAVVLVSSYAEGLPTILAEAGACGVPVITSAQGGCREIVTDGVNGLVVPTDDVPALAAAIERLMDDPALARRLGLAGRRIVEDRFGVKTVNAQILALYDRLLTERA